jgi:hypothetical protein
MSQRGVRLEHWFIGASPHFHLEIIVHDREFDEACLFCDHRGCTQCACDTLRICGSRKFQ